MQTQDLNALTTTDLEKLSERVATILKSRQEAERTDAIEKIKNLAGRVGLSVSIHENGAGPGDKRGGAAPRYRNPNKSTETWSGRGRAPRWLLELETNGRNRAEFLIDKES